MSTSQNVSDINPFKKQRSQGSREFEAWWRGLPRTGLIPEWRAFIPARAIRFLPKLILVEAPNPTHPRLYFRLAGEMLNENVQQNLAGTNWLDFLPPEQHTEALASARLICGHPCGIWQLNPVHYEGEYSQDVEATIFPLGPTADGIPLMLGSLEYLKGAEHKAAAPGKGMSAETSSTYEFIDIGAGVPSPRA